MLTACLWFNFHKARLIDKDIGEEKMKNIAVYIILFSIVLMAVSGFLFLFMNKWQLAEVICFVIGLFLLINAEKIENLISRK